MDHRSDFYLCVPARFVNDDLLLQKVAHKKPQ